MDLFRDSISVAHAGMWLKYPGPISGWYAVQNTHYLKEFDNGSIVACLTIAPYPRRPIFTYINIFNPSRYVLICYVKWGMKSLIHLQISKAAPLKFGNGDFHPTDYDGFIFWSMLQLELTHIPVWYIAKECRFSYTNNNCKLWAIGACDIWSFILYW